jgi:glucokinase-like ROK family protein
MTERNEGSQHPVLALDIGGTKLAVAVVTADGSAHGLLIEPTPRGDDWRSGTRQLFDMGRRAVKRAGVGEILAVGIACGGPLDAASGLLLCPPHLPGWVDVPLGPLAAEAFGVPFALQNDATVAAIAEYRFGAGRGTGTMLYLTVSTGVGGGAIINGALHRGAAGNGGEFGHIMVHRGGRLCSCGRRGCVEAYASGTSIAERAREALADGAKSTMAALPTVTAADVAAAAAAGDALAEALWADTVDLLGAAVTDLVNVFEPDLVVLGGGVTRAGAMLIDPVREVVAREAMAPAAHAVRVVLAELGDLVGVVGAGVIAHALLSGGDPTQPHASAPKNAIGPETGDGHMADWLATQLGEHLAVAEATATLSEEIRSAGALVCDKLARGGTVYTFGNGGSAADAQHLTGELIGRYKRDRRPLPAVTLSTDPSAMTCIANDYSYEDVFKRQIEALAGPDDVVVAFTTSGGSPNVVAALAAAQTQGATTLLFAGGDGGPASVYADRTLLVPSKSTQRIQEMHTLMLHVISEIVDAWAAGEEPAT